MRNLRAEQKVLAAVAIGGAALWVLDSIVDSLFFRENTFWQSLSGRFSLHELYFRTVIIVSFVLLGFVVSRFVKRQRAQEDKLRKALAAYEDERTKSSSVLQAIPDGLSIQSRDFRVLFQNEVHRQLAGDHQGEYCYEAYSKLGSICPDCPVNESFRDGKTHVRERVRTEGGVTVELEIRSSPLLNAKGEIIAGIEAVRDISGRKRLEASLEEQKRFAESVIENSAVATFVLGPDHTVRIWNKACERLTGIPASRIIGTDGHWRAFYREKRPTLADIIIDGNEQELPRLYRNHSRSQLTSNGLQAEDWYEDLNGKDRFIIFDANPIYTGAGDLAVVIETVQDITDRKRSEERITLFSEAVAEAMDGIQIVDLTGHILFSNRAVEEIYGYTAAELLGRHVNEMNADPEFAGRVILPAIGEKGRWSGEIMVCHKDGHEFPVWLSAALVRNDERTPIAMIGVIRDITERRRAEEALKESEEKYKNLVELSADIIYRSDKDGNQQFMNDAAFKTLGYAPDEVIGKPVINLIHPDDRERTWGKRREMVERGTDVFNFENRYLTKSGDTIHVLHNVRVLRNEKGEITGTQGIARDITERKRVEEELRSYREQLEELVRERTRELIVANERLTGEIAERRRMEEELLRAQKLESLSLLAGGVAHDFNNLLASMMGNISLTLMDLPASSPSHRQLESAERAALRARDLTVQLLAFSRGGAPVMSSTSMEDVVRDTAGFSLRGSKSRLSFSFSENLLPVEADQVQLAQVINNLIINADQAMPDGGTIAVSGENTELRDSEIPPLPAGSYVRVTIHDQGIGIPREHLAKIFDPYFTTKQKGSGLGLAICYSIIRNHKGLITVDSEAGNGTVFRIYLPAAAEHRSEALPKEQKLYSGAAKILVMDDEADVRKTTGDMLVRLGYTVAFADEGARAIDLYREAREAGEPFDLIIMDLTVPGGMGGRDAVTKLLELDPEALVIVSSGYSKDHVLSDFAKYGFKGAIAKPFRVRDLSETIHRVLDGRR